jgi:microcystin-dependent protein
VSDPFVAEIRLFAGNFPPNGWAFCNGQLLPIAQNTALFSLLGTNYGGDGKTTFGLPDLRSRAAIQPGTGPGLTERQLGETGGDASVTLTTAQLPGHVHALQASSALATTTAANGNMLATVNAPNPPWHEPVAMAPMGPNVLMASGGGAPHQNMQPYLHVSFMIATQGIFPPRW